MQGAGLDHYFGCAEQGARAARALDRAFGPQRVDGLADGVAGLGRRLNKAGPGAAEEGAQRLAVLETALRGLDPKGPLERGTPWCAWPEPVNFFRDPQRVTKGDALDITVRDGRVAATVTDTRPNED